MSSLVSLMLMLSLAMSVVSGRVMSWQDHVPDKDLATCAFHFEMYKLLYKVSETRVISHLGDTAITGAPPYSLLYDSGNSGASSDVYEVLKSSTCKQWRTDNPLLATAIVTDDA